MRSIFIFFTIISFTGFSQTKYVDVANGNDSYNGNSTTSAWQTIQKAMDEAAPGTTVLIRNGNYVESGLQLNVSGALNSYITFKNYPGENPVISGNNQQGTLLYIEDQSYFHIEGLEFANAVGNFSIGVEITGDSHDFFFRKNHIHDIKWNAINSLPDSNDNANGLVIYGTTAIGVYNFTIDSNEVNNNITGFSESLTLDGNVFNFGIIANSVHDNSNIGILCAGNYGVNPDPLADYVRSGHIQDNICYNNNSNYATSAGIYIDGARQLYITQNLCYGNGYGIEIGAEENGTTSQIYLYDNLIYDNYEAGLAIGGYTASTTGQVINSIVRNNTIYNNTLGTNYLGEIYITKATNINFENNIIVSGNDNKLILIDLISPQADLEFHYNMWYTADGDENSIQAEIGGFFLSTYAAMNTALDQTFSSFEDPQFTSTLSGNYDLRPLSSSPAINTGDPAVNLFPVEKDFDDELRIDQGIIDIGVYENNVVGIMENEDYTFHIWPNPSSKTITVTGNTTGSFTIVNGSEEIVMEGSIDKTMIIDIEDLSSGYYFLTIKTEKGLKTRIFIKD